MPGQPVYRFASVELDVAKGCLRREGREEYPRAKNLQVLLYLVEHRERVVAKEELIEAVWKDTSATDDVLFHSIKELRALLDDSRGNPRFIRTFPGTGYRFVAPVEEAPASIRVGPAKSRRVWTIATLLAVAGAIWGGFAYRWGTAPPPPNEVAWWRFDEKAGATVLDSSGRGITGQVAGAFQRVPGRFGPALRFDSPATFVQGNARGLPSGSSPRTITAWIRAQPNGDETGVFHYGAKGPDPPAASFALSLKEAGQPSAGNRWLGGYLTGASKVADDQWHFLSAVYEGPWTNTVRLFVDGLQDAAGTLSRAPATRTSGGWTAGRLLESGASLRGALDDLRVFSRALSQQEISALYRCTGFEADLTTLGGPAVYFIPIMPNRPMAIVSGDAVPRTIGDPGTDISGIQFAVREAGCAVRTLRGADLGQDLGIEADVHVPRDPHGYATEAGPYFRSRRAHAGDGIVGGTSAGYWVTLNSTGRVRVRCLNPNTVTAFSGPIGGFEESGSHHIRAEAAGSKLRIWVDGRLVALDQAGRTVTAVDIPALWQQGTAAAGTNGGAAGMAFYCYDHRDCEGAESASNVRVTRLSQALPDRQQ